MFKFWAPTPPSSATSPSSRLICPPIYLCNSLFLYHISQLGSKLKPFPTQYSEICCGWVSFAPWPGAVDQVNGMPLLKENPASNAWSPGGGGKLLSLESKSSLPGTSSVSSTMSLTRCSTCLHGQPTKGMNESRDLYLGWKMGIMSKWTHILKSKT